MSKHIYYATFEFLSVLVCFTTEAIFRRKISSSWISVSSKGEQFLASSRPDYQPPLVLTLTAEMLEEDNGNTQEEFKTLSTSELEGFSEVGN